MNKLNYFYLNFILYFFNLLCFDCNLFNSNMGATFDISDLTR